MDDLEIFRKLANCQDKEQMVRVIEEYNEQNKPMTNADRLRAMTDEEWLEFAKRQKRVWFNFPCGVVCEGKCEVNTEEECHKIIMRWLKQPAKE